MTRAPKKGFLHKDTSQTRTSVRRALETPRHDVFVSRALKNGFFHNGTKAWPKMEKPGHEVSELRVLEKGSFHNGTKAWTHNGDTRA